jgi:trans-aconitate methyltransferase
VAIGDRAHWDHRYDTIGPESVSWHQDTPVVSLELIAAVSGGTRPSLIDVGGGASTLVDHLLAAGHTDVTVLDLSPVALDAARRRVGERPEVTWQARDLLTWEPDRTWGVWHDRAVLHFLLTDDDRARYAGALRKAVAPGGAVVIGTFAEDGPTNCSGLPVRRHSAADLRALLGDLEIVEERREVHRTPGGAAQPFTWIAGRLRWSATGGDARQHDTTTGVTADLGDGRG